MKNAKFLIISLLLVFCMLGSLIACTTSNNDNDTTPATYSYVAIDINPSLELVLDENGVVVSVNALNEDALVLISGEQIEGLTLDETSELIVSLASELGYLNEENTDVNFTVVTENESLEAELEVKLEEGAKRGCDMAEIKFKAKEELDELINEAKEQYPELEEKLHAGKLHLIKAIQKFDPEFTVEQGLELEVCELAKMLYDLKKENDEKTPKETKEAFEKQFKEAKDEARRKIAGVYGENFLQKWEDNEELKANFEQLKAEYEAIIVSAEHVCAIEELLEIDLSELKDENGAIALCTLNEEIKNSLKECAKEIFDEAVAILRSYEEQILNSEAFKNATEGLKPDTDTEGSRKFERFEEFDSFVREENEKIKQEKKDIRLDDNQREQIEDFKNEMKGKFDELDGELGEFFEKVEELFPKK